MTNGAVKCTLFITAACKAWHTVPLKKTAVSITMVNLVRPVTTFLLTQAIFYTCTTSPLEMLHWLRGWLAVSSGLC